MDSILDILKALIAGIVTLGICISLLITHPVIGVISVVFGFAIFRIMVGVFEALFQILLAIGALVLISLLVTSI